MAHEQKVGGLSGWLAIFVAVLVAAAAIWSLATFEADWTKPLGAALLVLAGATLAGLTVVNPNEAAVITLFGVYKGTLSNPDSGGSIRSRRAANCRCGSATSRARS